jgi:hypothetical protein
MKWDLHSLFGLHAQLYSLDKTQQPPPPPPPHLGSYKRVLLVSQDRRRLFVTPCSLYLPSPLPSYHSPSLPPPALRPLPSSLPPKSSPENECMNVQKNVYAANCIPHYLSQSEISLTVSLNNSRGWIHKKQNPEASLKFFPDFSTLGLAHGFLFQNPRFILLFTNAVLVQDRFKPRILNNLS